MIDEEFLDRLRRAAPVRLYASGVDGARVFWPWRMNKAGGPMGPASRRRHAAKCDHYVLDSNFGDESITNQDVLDEAAELGADAAVLADVYQDMEATVGALLDGLDLAGEHHYDGTVVLPLQAPHAECYRRIEPSVDRDVWWAVGGCKDAPAAQKIEAARDLRAEAGPESFIHGLGFGVTDRLAGEIRRNPGLLDSIDNSTSMSNAVESLGGTPEKMTIAAAQATADRLRDLRAVTHFAEPENTHRPSTLGEFSAATDGGTPAQPARRGER